LNGGLSILLLLIPALGALLCAMLPQTVSRGWALLVSLATFLIALIMACQFDYSSLFTQFNYNGFEIKSIGASFSLGVDAISLWLIVLTALLMPLAILASFRSIKDRAREYYAWMLLLQCAMLGVFAARDLLVFYIFFELTLVPMFFIIGIWGGPERRYAAGKFFLFTFTGSVFTLAGAIYLGFMAGSFNIERVVLFAQYHLTSTERYWLLLALLAGFAVKVPLFPVHTWLPLAHTEAPTAGSVILAGVLLKLGTYGLLRLAVPIGMIAATGVAFARTLAVIGILCVIGIIYGALVAWVQQDIKKLVAYSSVSHLGFCVLGLLALNTHGIEGSILYMINHGISTGALFLVVGMIYDRYHTRDINQLSGLAKRMPILACFFVFFSLSSIGLPGLNGFVSEFLTILGAFTSQYLGMTYGAFAALGIILGAVYMLHMVARVIFGPLKTPVLHGERGGHGGHDDAPGDIGAREITILIPLAIAVVWLGVYPTPLLHSLNIPVGQMQAPLTQNMTEASAR
jgi:NADH-quinone oxidoreductase subunit M